MTEGIDRPRSRWLWRVCWLFIFAVALGDIAFAYGFRHSLPLWEANPVCCWAFRVGGIWAVAALRVSVTGYAWLMACTRTRWSDWITWVWLTTHLALAAYLPACLAEAAAVTSD